MLKIGLIGCGFMGTMHANCYKNIKDVEVVAFSDIIKEKAEKLAQGTNAEIYGDGFELIENAEVDIIDICLPTYLHADYAVASMDKVKYVFVEKPLALTKEQGLRICKKQEESGAEVQVGQVIRFWDEYVKLKEILDSGELGDVLNANFRRISPIPSWGWNDWALKEELSGGAAQDLHIHDVDFALHLFGKPKTTCAIKNKKGEANSYICSLLGYDDFCVTIEGTWALPTTHPFEATFRVVCQKGVVENAGGKFMLYTNDSAKEIELEKTKLSGDEFEGGNISDLGGYFNELVYFTNCAKKGESIKRANVKSANESLAFVLDEIKNAK